MTGRGSRMAQLSDLYESRYQQPLEEELRATFARQEGLLYNMLVYQLGWVDEQGTPLSHPSSQRLYPLLCLLSCEALLGEYRPALPAAAAVELVHNFSLIHEDVQMGSPNRGHRPTLWWIWGPGQAINAGDGMHALARLSLMAPENTNLSVARVLRCVRLLDQCCLSMCEGQHLDLAFQEKLDVGTDAYFRMAAAKTGALMSCAMGLGALAATEDEGIVEAFRECGKHLGIADQIMSDIRQLSGNQGEGAPSSALLNKTKLLPIVYTFETADVHTKRELGTIYFKRVLEAQDVEQVISILNEKAALQYARQRARDYLEMAVRSLEGTELFSRGREELESTFEHMIPQDG